MSSHEPLSKAIVDTLRAILLKLDRSKGVNEHVKMGLRVLKSFVGAIRVKAQGIEFSVDIDGEQGIADSGTLSRDLPEVFVATGEAAKARSSSIVILIDEFQNLSTEELEALIMALHRVNQKKLTNIETSNDQQPSVRAKYGSSRRKQTKTPNSVDSRYSRCPNCYPLWES